MKMVKVTTEEFYAIVNPLDCYPYLGNERWDKNIGYKSTWKLKNGNIIGYSYGDEFTTIKRTYEILESLRNN